MLLYSIAPRLNPFAFKSLTIHDSLLVPCSWFLPVVRLVWEHLIPFVSHSASSSSFSMRALYTNGLDSIVTICERQYINKHLNH